LARAVVVDATALLAVLLSEPGADKVLPVLERALVSAVNVAEVYAHLLHRGVAAELAWRSLEGLGFETCAFTADHARRAGELAGKGRRFSFGERACVALAMTQDAVVYTTNEAWKGIGVEVEVIR
jgi:ribonuclease VapC